MLWRSKKKKIDSSDELGNLADLTLDEQVIAADNVMTCRDVANLFMNIIAEHRGDGHECLPYCMPVDLHEQLELLEPDELKMILTVILKDMYDVYYRMQMGQL